MTPKIKVELPKITDADMLKIGEITDADMLKVIEKRAGVLAKLKNS